MNVAIRYYSRGGNVEAMAEAISRGTGVEAISIDSPEAPITEKVDLLFMGAALYAFKLDPKVYEYIESLDEELIGEVICFGSSMLTRRPVLILQDLFKKKGVKINKQAIYSRNHPNDDLLGVIEYFAENELTRDRSLDGLPPYKIFQRSQELKAEREAAKAAALEEAAAAAVAEAEEEGGEDL